MTGIISMAETLQAGYDRLSDKQKKDAIDVIVNSSYSLKAFDDNISTLSKLSKPNYKLDKEDINFSDLVYNRIQLCRRLYEKNPEDREFVLRIAEDITVSADRNYMTQLLDNLIINTIKYCKDGKINITLNKDNIGVHLVIIDEGIGIPMRELYEIFDPFTVSSRTKTQASGRGVGLTICQRILEVHGGTIKAESDGVKGATFRVMLPISKKL
jgi:signal transduction histidine kinase